jgi:hypothetical protein
MNPEAYSQQIALQVVSGFAQAGQSLDSMIVKDATHGRVCRIMNDVCQGALRTLTRLEKSATSKEEKERLHQARGEYVHV